MKKRRFPESSYVEPKLNRGLPEIFRCWPRELGSALKYSEDKSIFDFFETRKIYCHCESCNLARVTTAEVENLQETGRFMSWVFHWLTEIQSDSLLYGRENKESVSLVSFIASSNGEVSLKTEIVLIRVHFTGS